MGREVVAGITGLGSRLASTDRTHTRGERWENVLPLCCGKRNGKDGFSNPDFGAGRVRDRQFACLRDSSPLSVPRFMPLLAGS